MNDLQKLSQDEQLARFVDALLEEDHLDLSSDQDIATLQTLTQKIVRQNREYPGAPKLDSQKKLALITEYRRVMSPPKATSQNKRSPFGAFHLPQWGVAAGAFLIIAVVFLIFNNLDLAATPATATGENSLLPLIAALTAGAIIVFIWIGSKRK